MTLIIIIVFLVFALIGMPLAFTLGFSSFWALFYGGMDLQILPQRMMHAVDNFPLMAIPLFMLAGEIMVESDIIKRLINFSNSLVGRVHGGLAHVMPIYSFIFLFFTMSNIGLPGTGSFIGEFLILTGSFVTNTSITFISATGMILGGCYSLWLYNRVCYGNLKTQYIKNFVDLNKREFLIFLPLLLGTLLMGILPNIFLLPIHMSVDLLFEHLFH